MTLPPPQHPGEPVNILGSPWTIPAKRPPYPATYEERMKAPWPLQAGQALESAWSSILGLRKFETLLPYVRSLPCDSEDDALFLQRVTTRMSAIRRQLLPVEIIGMWRNLLLRTEGGLGNSLSPFLHGWALRFDDADAWRYAHVLLLDRIEKGDVYGTAFHLHWLKERINAEPGRELPGRIPYTAALQIVRRANSDTTLSQYVREQSLAEVARLFGGTLPDENRLAAGAAAETQELGVARKRLAAEKQCRRGEKLESH